MEVYEEPTDGADDDNDWEDVREDTDRAGSPRMRSRRDIPARNMGRVGGNQSVRPRVDDDRSMDSEDDEDDEDAELLYSPQRRRPKPRGPAPLVPRSTQRQISDDQNKGLSVLYAVRRDSPAANMIVN
jgi:hypothetical protein